ERGGPAYRNRTPMRLLIAATVLLAGSSPAFAHHLLSKATLVGDRLRVEAYYDDGTPSQEAKVTVRQGDRVVVEGRTDDTGVWTCAGTPPGSNAIGFGSRIPGVGRCAADPRLMAATPPGSSSGGRRRSARRRTSRIQHLATPPTRRSPSDAPPVARGRPGRRR